MRASKLLLASLAVVGSLNCIATAAPAGPTTQQGSAAMYVEVYVRGEKRDQKVFGTLGEHDDDHLVVTSPAGTHDLKWDDLTANSGFTLKSRLIDKAKGDDWLALGTWGWEHGLEKQAKTAFAMARKLDANLSGAIDAVLIEPSGSKSAAPTPPAAATPVATPPAVEGEAPEKPDATAGADPANPGEASDQNDVAKLTPAFEKGQKITHYTTPTPEQVTASLARSRKYADKVRAQTKTELKELETTHFLIYTDWDPREYGFLKDKCEGAYSVLARQFAVKENVFVGKLPVFMFTKPAGFQKFAAKMDKFSASPYVLGYFIPSDEIGHMAMWKPGVGPGEGIGAGQNLADAQRKWAQTLVHEFSHAFLNRYKSDAKIPRWMNEGLAEVISESELPTNNYHANAREIAMAKIDIMGLFEDTNMPTGAAYPVMMTMVEYLVKKDNKGFVSLVNAIKDGADPEDSLEKLYGFRYSKFADLWLKYARGLK